MEAYEFPKLIPTTADTDDTSIGALTVPLGCAAMVRESTTAMNEGGHSQKNFCHLFAVTCTYIYSLLSLSVKLTRLTGVTADLQVVRSWRFWLHLLMIKADISFN